MAIRNIYLKIDTVPGYSPLAPIPVLGTMDGTVEAPDRIRSYVQENTVRWEHDRENLERQV